MFGHAVIGKLWWDLTWIGHLFNIEKHSQDRRLHRTKKKTETKQTNKKHSLSCYHETTKPSVLKAFIKTKKKNFISDCYKPQTLEISKMLTKQHLKEKITISIIKNVFFFQFHISQSTIIIVLVQVVTI